MPAPRPLLDRFWEKVNKTDGCWLWTASLDSSGYGHIAEGRKLRLAHRLSWEIHFGPIPNGLLVCHECDVRSCVNPGHLFLGTNTDNMRDMSAKGRSHAPRKSMQPARQGESNGRAKLNGAQVRELRRLYASGDYTLTQLSVPFGVSFSTVHRAISGRGWRCVSS